MPQDKSASARQFERAHPEDPANAPGWDRHVDEFFNSEAFPGDGVRKATDAMKTDAMREGASPDMPGGSSQGTGDRRSLRSGEVNTERKTGRPTQPEPGEG